MLSRNLKDYLDGRKVKYDVLAHHETYTAQETAESAHIPGKELAKTVMVKVDGEMAMAVLPASRQIDFGRLRADLGADDVRLAHEEEFVERFPDSEVGAMPPFGNLYGLKVYVDESLAGDEEIVFNAGSHAELIKMSYRDFDSLVKPRRLAFSTVAR